VTGDLERKFNWLIGAIELVDAMDTVVEILSKSTDALIDWTYHIPANREGEHCICLSDLVLFFNLSQDGAYRPAPRVPCSGTGRLTSVKVADRATLEP